MKTSKKETQENLPILRVNKSASCPSLRGTSELSYLVAADAKEDLYLELSSNTGRGHFRDEWIAYADAKSALPLFEFSSIPLRKLFKNRSLNSSGFLLAALLNLGTVEPTPGQLGRYQTADDSDFLKQMTIAINSGYFIDTVHTDDQTPVASDKPTKKTQRSRKP